MYGIVLALLLVALLSRFADARGRTSSSKAASSHSATTHTYLLKVANHGRGRNIFLVCFHDIRTRRKRSGQAS
jgi:hypothetical protein